MRNGDGDGAICMSDGYEECTMRSLLRRYISDYYTSVKRTIREKTSRVYARLRYIYIRLFGTVRSKLLLELEARLGAYSIGLGGALASALAGRDGRLAVKVALLSLDTMFRDVAGICIIQHGEDYDKAIDCVREMMRRSINLSLGLITPVVMGLAFASVLRGLSQVLEQTSSQGVSHGSCG